MSANVPQIVERKKWQYVSPEQATPETPSWQIKDAKKETTFIFQGTSRSVKYGQCKPFHSVEELSAFAAFVEQLPDFCLHCGKVQDPIDPSSITTLPDGRVAYMTKGVALATPYKHITSLSQVHAQLWVTQFPWEPVPPEYRWWTKTPLFEEEVQRFYSEVRDRLTWIKGTPPDRSVTPNSKLSFSRTDPAYARYVIEKLLPEPGVRQMVLKLLAECIREHQIRPDAWGITLEPTSVGLNAAGRFYTMQIRQGRVAWYFAPFAGDDSWETVNPYTSFPQIKCVWLKTEDILIWLDTFRNPVLELIRDVAAKSVRMMIQSKRAHSAGVLRYMEEELGLTEPLPDPSYWPLSDSPPAQQYWAMQVNPTFYNMEKALKEQKVDTWRVDNSKVSIGDRLIVWKAKGNDEKAGIIALAEVVESPKIRKPLHMQYRLQEKPEPELLSNRAMIRYVLSTKLPIWKEVLSPQLVELSVAQGIPGNTFKVTEPQWEALLDYIGGWPEGESGPAHPQPIVLPDFPRNTILYGPPGTGKTYGTIRKAVQIIDGIAPKSTEEAKARWDELRANGRIEFVTFHQSYGYEDFVEGIRPVLDDAAPTPRYEISDGILKKIALRALGAMLEPLPISQDAGAFDQVWKLFREDYDANPERTYKGLTEATEYRLSISHRGAIRATNVRNTDTATVYNTSIEKLRKVYDTYRNAYDKITTSQVQEVIGSYGHHILTATLYRELRRIADSGEIASQTTIPPTEPEYRAGVYLESGNQAAFHLNTESAERFVLIIDEINRGNISKVFGELITLIEDDKRIGADLAMTVTLPFSREAFGLPSNLYILGTMNTADKSIALVDVALRRRFEFEELMPDFGTCAGLTPTMRAVLEELNRRIILRKDRDHQIGHAFFIRVSEEAGFNRAFEKKVIPLLQEYFYGDWEALRFVLGEAEGKQRFIQAIEGAEVKGARNRWQWYRDNPRFVGPLNILDTLSKNYDIRSDTESDSAE